MRILFVSNYYPPCSYAWGYQQLCEEVADGLFARGHTVAVLTSTYGDGDETAHPYPVHRVLPIDPDWNSGRPAIRQFFAGRRKRERQGVADLHRVVDDFRPDAVFVWHFLGLSRVLLREIEQLRDVAVAYYFADYLPEMNDEYLDYWQSEPVHWAAKLYKPWLAKWAIGILTREGKPVSLQYANVACVSQYVRQRLVSQGLIPARAVVIHNGVDLAAFSGHDTHPAETLRQGLNCLIAGRLVATKGVHTAVEAFGRLHAAHKALPVHLTILGDGPNDYLRHLESLVRQYSLQDVVRFQSPVPRIQMSQVLSAHNILILPSEWAEPLARSIQEAMAMGLLVIGTTTGGSGELLKHDETGLVFEAGNAESLAIQLQRVWQESDFARGVAEAGRRAVVKDFTIDLTITNVERYLAALKSEIP